jgi:hypothetical protein
MRSGAELRLRYHPDDEWTGRLSAVVKSGAFAGEGSAWFTPDQIKAFIATLRAVPFAPGSPPKIEGGFWSKETPGILDQCHLGIAIAPHGSLGALLVRVELASPAHDTPDRDLQHIVVVRFLTEYAAIARFANQLARVLNGAPEEAVLEGAAE